MKILLLSAYAAHSHVHWQRSLLAMQLVRGGIEAPDVSAFCQSNLRPRYQQVFLQLAGAAG